MTIPHAFPSLIEDPLIQTVLIAGAGLSSGNIPVISELKIKLDEAAQLLQMAPCDDFYLLAENILNDLINGGKSDSESRLWLAGKLGMFDDRRWFGERGLPLSGNTPRHRVIARFAVENCLKAIISLNWDTLLEAALDSVGLANSTRSPRPWIKTSHACVVEGSHLPKLANQNVFPVIKPHGCVRELERARRQFQTTGIAPPIIFKLTVTELGNLPAEQQSIIDNSVKGYIAECPLIAIGWKAEECYLRDAIVETAEEVLHPVQDAFTLIDLYWDQNHTIISTAYKKNNNDSFAEVKANSSPTTDCLFQWLQAKYALNKLMASSPNMQQTLMQFLQLLGQPVNNHFISRWVDCWLPTWVRLCWRAGLMQGADPLTGQEIKSCDIPVIPRDIHIPLAGMAVIRRELQAAAKLLTTLGNDLSLFDFEKYPGGLWDAKTLKLYIPLPGWQSMEQFIDLAALNPLIDALRGLGFVKDIHLVWLNTEDAPPDQRYSEQIAAQVRRLMPLEKFARSDALTWVNLEELKEYP